MDFSEERNMILDMVAEGRISVDDAKQLLDALEKSAAKKETSDDFFVSPGMDFHIPEVHIPNVNRIVDRARRRTMSNIAMHSDELGEMRENLEDELQILRDEMEILKAEAKNIAAEIREQVKEHEQREEDWEA